MTVHPPAVWLGFTGLVLALLVLDLGVLNRRSHVLTFREALGWSTGLFAVAMAFGGFLWWREGHQHALEYYSGYLIELSLSVDNLFVFILIFQYFAVPPALQVRVLKWGILGAILMRAVFIGLGAFLLQQFAWITWVFGLVLIVTGFKVFRAGEEEIHPEKNPLVRLARKVFPVTPGYEGQRFFVTSKTGLMATPLFLVLLVVEWSDLVFAIDSIPAVFAVTRDPFIVYSSNIFAILGLRALFFVLADAMQRFAQLKTGVALILIFVGAKMVLEPWLHVPTAVSLGVIVATLAGAILFSVVRAEPGAEG